VSGKSAHSEADEATRGTAVKLAAELSSRLLTFATTWLLGRALGVADFGRFNLLAAIAVLLAELGELGLQNLASRALVAGTHSLRSLARARLLLLGLVALVALLAVPLAPALASQLRAEVPDGAVLALLVLWFALAGWCEFTGVALRCRGGRLQEALLLVVLRGLGLVGAGSALAAGAGLRGVALALALSPLPALVLGYLLLRRYPEPHPAAGGPPLAVLRESAPLAVHGGLLLLSPRVEFLVLSRFASAAVTGSFAAALLFLWPLALVPSAVVAGAMPALTREALRGGDAVRRRTAATAGALAAPAAVGLALVAPALVRVLLGPGYEPAGALLRLLAASLPAAFQNALVAGALIAAGRAAWLPRLTAGRVVLALALAFVLVPRFAATGAAAGLVCAEWTLLAAGRFACRRAGFPVPAGAAIGWGLVACVPMALAVSSVRASLPLALGLGGLTWIATLAAAALLAPSRVRQLAGDLRYPWGS
jgi:O-antigen/teichoic acid export membrane protein